MESTNKRKVMKVKGLVLRSKQKRNAGYYAAVAFWPDISRTNFKSSFGGKHMSERKEHFLRTAKPPRRIFLGVS